MKKIDEKIQLFRKRFTQPEKENGYIIDEIMGTTARLQDLDEFYIQSLKEIYEEGRKDMLGIIRNEFYDPLGIGNFYHIKKTTWNEITKEIYEENKD